MPPRLAKKGPGRGRKTPTKASREAAAVETAKIEEVTAKIEEKKEEIKVEDEKFEEKPSIEESVVAQDTEDVKASYEEDRGERLDLEDNEPEYEHDEDTVVDYDEQDMEHEEGQEFEGDGTDEIGEDGDMVEEEEAEMVDDEEMEDGGKDAEGEEIEGKEEHDIDGDEEERHEVVKEHRKRKEFEVFVGGLDKDATEDDLRKVFSAVGEISEVRLMMNPLTKKNKGFAFLRFATVEQAKRAVSELKTPVVNGKQCGVAPCQDNDTLFVGNICKTWTKEYLKEKLKNIGIENVEDITLVEDTNNEGMNRGFAFLEFLSRSEAMEAFKRLQKRDVFFGTERNARVSFADSFIEPDDEIMAKVKTVFIDGLSAAWDEDRVKEYLKKFGQVEKIELARNMPSAKRKDFGFVTFDTHDNAVACAEGINNKELGEGDSKVKVRARLSRPLQKGRVKYGIHGEMRIGRGAPRGGHISYRHPPPPRFPVRTRAITGRGAPVRTRAITGRGAPVRSRAITGRGAPVRTRAITGRGAPIAGRGFKRPVEYREKRPSMVITQRPRRLPPSERSYDRTPPVPTYHKSSSRREYGRHDDPPPRSRAPAEYTSRVPIERRSAFRDEYSVRASGYSDIAPRSAPRVPDRRAYADEGYGRKLERLPPSYREGRVRDYDSLSGSKRAYSELDDAPRRYPDASLRHSRARLEYDVSSSDAQYNDGYDDRLGRSHMGYGSSRSSLSGQDGLYSSRQGVNYGRGPVGGSDIGGMYSSSYGGSYLSRGSDVGGSSYSSMYSGRSMSGNGYLGGNGSGSYY